MSIADQKKADNIVEYILYMWNMEGLQRACNFDDEIISKYISQSVKDDSLQDELEFHQNLKKSMLAEGLEKAGHIYELNEIMIELMYLHNTLMSLTKDRSYINSFEQCQGFLEEFKKKTDGKVNNDIEAMITAIFGFLNLKMTQQEISEGTQEAIDAFSSILALLAAKYKLMKQGHLNVNLN